MLNRRRFLRLGGAAGIGALSQLLTACGDAPTPIPVLDAATRAPAATPDATTLAPPTPAAQNTALPTQVAEQSQTLALDAPAGFTGIALKPYFAYGQWTEGCASANDIAKRYMASKPEVSVLGADCNVSWQNFNLSLVALQKDAKPIDTYFFQGTPHDLAFRGELLPLDGLMQASGTSIAEQWAANPLKSCRWQGKTYALPLHVLPYTNIAVNTTLFAKKGIATTAEVWPKTWAELRRLSAEFTVWDGNTIKRAGLLPELFDIRTIALINDAPIFDIASNTFKVDAQPTIDMLQFFVDWMNEEYKGQFDLIQRRPTSPKVSFPQATQAMDPYCGPWMADSYFVWREPIVDARQFIPMPWPVGPAAKAPVVVANMNVFALPRTSKHPQEAFDYMAFTAQQPTEAFAPLGPMMPGHQAAPPVKPWQKLVDAQGSEAATAFFAYFAKQTPLAFDATAHPLQDEVTEALNNAITRMTDPAPNKRKSPKDALAQAQKVISIAWEKAQKN
jgi:multiple sugar transport system substrate-binding protein